MSDTEPFKDKSKDIFNRKRK